MYAPKLPSPLEVPGPLQRAGHTHAASEVTELLDRNSR